MPQPAQYYVPQLSERGKKRFRVAVLLWLAVTLFMLCWMGMIIYAPLAVESGHHFVAVAIYKAFSSVCHQIPERSFKIFGSALAVCARCTGIYAGLTAGFLIYPLFRSLRSSESFSRIFLLLAPVPTGIDFLLGAMGIWQNTHLSRSVTGAILGIVCAFFIVPGLVDLAQIEWKNIFKKEKTVPAVEDEQENISEENVKSDYSRPSLRI